MIKRHQTTEFKAEAVRLVKESGKSMRAVARDLGVGGSTLYAWVRESEPADPETSAREGDELERLRRENKILLMERDILKKAAAFFAREKN